MKSVIPIIQKQNKEALNFLILNIHFTPPLTSQTLKGFPYSSLRP